MELVTLQHMKAHLGLTSDQTEDDDLISDKIDAAQAHIQRGLGYALVDRFETAEGVPADLREAVMQLAAWWFENRETVIERGNMLPFGVSEIIEAHRDWTF